MKVISNLKRFIKYVALTWMLHRASRKADSLQERTGITHYVIRQGRGLKVVTRKDYRMLVSKGKARYVTAEQMYQGCFYCTRWYNKNNPVPMRVIEQKRKNWLAANGL